MYYWRMTIADIQYNTIQYKNDFYSAVIEGADCRGARGQAMNGPVFNSSQTDEPSNAF